MQFLFALLVIILDQLSKRQLAAHAANSGVGFGAFQGQTVLVLVLVFSAVVGLVWYGARQYREFSAAGRAGFWLALGGAASNLVDRFRHGAVTDLFTPVNWFP